MDNETRGRSSDDSVKQLSEVDSGPLDPEEIEAIMIGIVDRYPDDTADSVLVQACSRGIEWAADIKTKWLLLENVFLGRLAMIVDDDDDEPRFTMTEKGIGYVGGLGARNDAPQE
jgi:hypothetical protein